MNLKFFYSCTENQELSTHTGSLQTHLAFLDVVDEVMVVIVVVAVVVMAVKFVFVLIVVVVVVAVVVVTATGTTVVVIGVTFPSLGALPFFFSGFSPMPTLGGLPTPIPDSVLTVGTMPSFLTLGIDCVYCCATCCATSWGLILGFL